MAAPLMRERVVKQARDDDEQRSRQRVAAAASAMSAGAKNELGTAAIYFIFVGSAIETLHRRVSS